MISNSNTSGRARLIGIMLLVTTFLAGGFSGAALERRASAAPAAPRPEAKAQPAERQEERPHGHRGRIFDQLDLTTVQRAAIDSILQDGREKVDAYWKETEPGYRALVDATRAQVRAVMTAEQLAEYDRLRAEHRAKAKHNGNDGGNGAAGKEMSSSNDSRGGSGNAWGGVKRKYQVELKETRTE
jgi:Spy/CpxP family protein refolding chaperone